MYGGGGCVNVLILSFTAHCIMSGMRNNILKLYKIFFVLKKRKHNFSICNTRLIKGLLKSQIDHISFKYVLPYEPL